MGLWTTENQDTMKDVLKAFNDAAYANYGNHSYGAGYLESLVVEMLAHCPKRYQKALISSMIGVTQRQEKEAIAKINKVANTHIG
jgi:hypothetical protein